MSHFYAEIDGVPDCRTTQCSAKHIGLTTYTASWKGCVKVHMYANKDGVDCVKIAFEPHRGKGFYLTVYDGPLMDRERAMWGIAKRLDDANVSQEATA